MHFHYMAAGDREYKCVSICPVLRQYRGGQECMNRVRRSLCITLLSRKKHPAHGSASHVQGVRVIKVFSRLMGMPGCCDTFVLIHSSLCTGGGQVGMLSLTSLPAKVAAVSAEALLKASLHPSLLRYSVKYQFKFKHVVLCFVLIFKATEYISFKYSLCPWQMTRLVPRQLLQG